MRRLVLNLVVLALGTGLPVQVATNEPTPMPAEPDHVVHAGAVPIGPRDSDALKPYVFQEYFPGHLRVQRGDLVRWEFPYGQHADLAFHTVTFARHPDDIPIVRPDEVPETFAFHEDWIFSTGCGRVGQPVCIIDERVLTEPDALVSSGTYLQRLMADGRIEPFDAVIDLPPGTYEYFCTIHHSVMTGTVEVVGGKINPDSSKSKSKGKVDGRRSEGSDRLPPQNPRPEDFADRVRELTSEADALVEELSHPEPFEDETGQRWWTVHAGARTRDKGGVAVLGFVPAGLHIRPGEGVRWVAGDEMHGVTFPDTTNTVPLYFSFNCEYDDPGGGLPGVPLIGFLPFAGVPCPAGGHPELAFTPAGTDPQPAPGNRILPPGTYHNSGMLVPASAPDRLRGKPPGSGDHFHSTFDAVFPLPHSEPLEYRCAIHFPLMDGSVTVSGLESM